MKLTKCESFDKCDVCICFDCKHMSSGHLGNGYCPKKDDGICNVTLHAMEGTCLIIEAEEIL